MKAKDIAKFLDKTLEIKKIKDLSINGLQVDCHNNVSRIGFAVDIGMEVFKKAKNKHCNMLIVHHGMKWKKSKKWAKYVPIREKRIAYLMKNRISLYGAHLPLDRHPVYGNNYCLARLFKLKNIKPFSKYHNATIGAYGNREISLNALAKEIEKKLCTKTVILPFGKKTSKRIGIISGGGAEHLIDCVSKNIDTFITGEPGYVMYHYARELGINIIYAGHYKTETIGVKSLQKLVSQKFNIETVFIDSPTGV